MQVKINGSTVNYIHGSLRASKDIGRRSSASFSVIDNTGLHFDWGNPVQIYNDSAVLIYSGFVYSSKEKRVAYGNSALVHQVRVMDNHYLADKRRAAKAYTGMNAGSIVSDLVVSYLAAEGVIGSHAGATYTTQSDFNLGTNTRTQTTATGGGDVELAAGIGGPTFTRATIGYSSDGGNSASSGTPRYSAGKFSNGTFIEEGTTNLLSANQSGVETNTTGFTAVNGTTLTRDTGTFYYETASLKCVTTGAAGDSGFVTVNIAGTLGTVYAMSAWVNAPNGTLLKLIAKDNTNNVTTTTNFTANGSWQRITNTITYGASSGTGLQLKVLTQGTQAAVTFYTDGMQIEQKSYSTTWQVGGTARNNESMTIPVSAISASGGAWAAWVNVTANFKETSSNRYIFDARNSSANSNQISLLHETGGNLRAAFGFSGAITADYADASLSNGLHHIMMTWQANGKLYLLVDGTMVASRNLPQAPTGLDTLAIGSRYSTDQGWCNCIIDDVKIWGRALTLTEAQAVYSASVAQGVDRDTSYYLTLDSNLLYGYGGYHLSPTIDISKVGLVKTAGNVLTFSKTAPAGTTSSIEVSLDGGLTYASAGGSTIPGITAGSTDTSSPALSMIIRSTLTTTDSTLTTPSVTGYTYALTTSQIQDGPSIDGTVTFNYVAVTDCLNALAEKATFWWIIDQNKHLYFIAQSTNTGPSLGGSDMEESSVEVTNTTPLYRNREIARGVKATTSTQTDQRKGDGTTRAFTLNYPVASVPTITVNAASKTVGIKGIDTGKDFYWSKGDPVISQDNGGTLLTSSDTFQAVYTGMYTAVIQADDSAQQVARAALEGNSGIVEDVFDAPDTSSTAEAYQAVNAKLIRFSTSGKQLTFATESALTLDAGQLCTVTLTDHAISGSFLIEKIDMDDHMYSDDDFRLTYRVSALSGPTNTTWVEFFNNLINKAGSSIAGLSIGATSTLTVLASLTTENWSWSETSVNVTPATCILPNTSTYPDTTIYPC